MNENRNFEQSYINVTTWGNCSRKIIQRRVYFDMKKTLRVVFKGVFRTLSNISDGHFLPKIVKGFQDATIVSNKLCHRCLNRF